MNFSSILGFEVMFNKVSIFIQLIVQTHRFAALFFIIYIYEKFLPFDQRHLLFCS
jgi:hypothetical protein